MEGIVYFIHLNDNEAVAQVKIGMSKKTKEQRFKVYKKNAKVLHSINCANPREVELAIINKFCKEFVCTKGKEYFSGPLEQMIQTFDECIKSTALKSKGITINIKQLIEKAMNYVNEQISNGIIPSMDNVFKYIRPQIVATTNETIVATIDYTRLLSNLSTINDFVVPHIKLVDADVICIDNGGSSHMRTYLQDTCEFDEGIDYIIVKIKSVRRQGGSSTRHEYMLTPSAFKYALMRSEFPIYRLYNTLNEYLECQYRARIITYNTICCSLCENKIESKVDIKIETASTLHEVQDDLTETKEEVKIAKTYLQEKCITSTKNPSNANLHHMFACTTYFANGDQYVKFVTEQKSYVDKTVDARLDNDEHKVIIKPFYNANGIDLRHNVLDEFNTRRAVRIKSINDEIKFNDVLFNDELKKAIRAHNKLNPDNKRVFSEEKQKTPLVRLKDVSVKFSKLSFVYKANPHISFNEVLQIIIDVNGITQESPLQSDEE